MSNEILAALIGASFGLVAALLGGTLTGLFTWLNTRTQLRHEKKRDRNKLILDKLQELHEVVSQFRNVYRSLTTEQIKTLTIPQQFTVPAATVHRLRAAGFVLSPQGITNAST